jgi:multidrug efflux pump subunit AcrA (membrane-fusion protein)
VKHRLEPTPHPKENRTTIRRMKNALGGPSGRIAGIALVTATSAALGIGGGLSSGSAAEHGASSTLAVPVEMVGTGGVDGEQPGMSWPGQIISASDVQVQPSREGTIAAWSVTIGQPVKRGQVLGHLTSPTSPDFAVSLAEANGAVVAARGILEARRDFTDDREDQLKKLKKSLENELDDADDSARAEVLERLDKVEGQILDVERELEIARSELKAEETAYADIEDALDGDVSIVAPQSGEVSALLKLVGDFVEPGTAVASVSGGAEKTILFRIPGNVTPPKAGDSLTVVRPGFAKDIKQITITGVGASLASNGSRVADATFVEPVDWPARSSVRVIGGTGQDDAPPLVSLTAIWFDDDGRSNVWRVGGDDRIEARPVKTGRSLGNRIELLEGVGLGSRIVSVAGPALRSGMKLPKAAETPRDTGEEPAGDGHDHEH